MDPTGLPQNGLSPCLKLEDFSFYLSNTKCIYVQFDNCKPKGENKNEKYSPPKAATSDTSIVLTIHNCCHNFLKQYAPSQRPRTSNFNCKWIKWNSTELYLNPTSSYAKYKFVRRILPNKSTYRQQWSLDGRSCRLSLHSSWRHQLQHQCNCNRSRKQHIHVRHGQQRHTL